MQLGLFLMPATAPGRPLAETIDWNLEVIRRADALGYDEAWMGQHITSLWEPILSPQQIIARLIGETENIRLGTGVEVLYRQHRSGSRASWRSSTTWPGGEKTPSLPKFA